MSRRYTSDGKRRSSMTHATRSWECPCGRVLWGNGGSSSHKRACRKYKESRYIMLGQLMTDPIYDRYPEMQLARQHEFESLRVALRGGVS